MINSISNRQFSFPLIRLLLTHSSAAFEPVAGVLVRKTEFLEVITPYLARFD
jgi:hypothetical protein